MKHSGQWLLPEGVEEVLPGDAARLESLRRRLLDVLYRRGFDLVFPPLVEFLDSLLNGVGEDLDLQTAKLTDTISGRLLDDLILELSASLGTTIIVVTHDLASIFAIADNSVFLDPETKTMIAHGDPKKLLAESEDPKVIDFLTRGEGKNKP